MNNLCFYSLLASNQEVDFFTENLLDTGIAGELDHDILAILESIPQEAVLDLEAEALAEQWDIETTQDPECVEILESNPSMTFDHKWVADHVVRGIEF